MGFLDATGITTLVNKLKTKFQETLVSGTNIKTVGGNSLLGSGNISFPSVPTASTTAPSMDGTASYGSGTSYARSNHVHPTDTSRQEVLVSGTNIKTINNESILGSGNISVGGGGGGGASITTATVTIAASDWHIVNLECTKAVTGVTTQSSVIVSYSPGYQKEYTRSEVCCINQFTGGLTFRCSSLPTASIKVNVMIINS